MKLRKSFHIFLSIFDIIYKLLIYISIITLFISLVLFIVYIPTVKPIVNQINATNIVPNIKTAIVEFIRVDGSYLETFEIIKGNIETIGNIIENNSGRLMLYYVIFLLIIALAQFLWNLSYYATSNVINLFMNYSMKDNLTTNIIRNIKVCSKYSLTNLLINFPIGFLFLRLGYLLLINTLSIFTIFTPAIVLAVGLSLWTFKYVFFIMWLPTLVNEDVSVLRALGKSFKLGFKNFLDFYNRFWILGLVMFMGIVLSAVLTFGLALVIALPAIMIFYKTFELVIYYDIKKSNYYLNTDFVQEHIN